MQTCMESYFQEQELQEVVGESDVTPSEEATAPKKWRIKAFRVI